MPALTSLDSGAGRQDLVDRLRRARHRRHLVLNMVDICADEEG